MKRSVGGAGHDGGSAGRLRMLLVPSINWAPNWDAHTPGAYQDPKQIYRLLAAEHGIDTTLVDPFGLPWNPFAGRHQVFRGVDPVRALAIMLQERDADVVLACFEPGVVALLALRQLMRFRAKIAVVDIGLTENWAVRERMLDFVLPRADALYPLGTNQVEYIKRRWTTRGDVRFLFQHVDAEFFTPAAEAEAADGPVLTVGDDPGRDFATLLAAVDGVQAELLVKSHYEAVAAANVTFVRGRLPGPAYRDLFVQARLVVVPLVPMVTASGVGTVLEAMAMGKALIVSDSPGIRDYVTHEETALVVPCGDAPALRAAIQRLLAEPGTRARLGSAARAFVERHCSFPAHAAVLSSALRDLVGKAR